MSVDLSENEQDEVVKFLNTIIPYLPEEPGISLKPSCYCMSGAEIEGEVIETVSNYLRKRNCHDVVSSAFAQHTFQELISKKLTEFELKPAFEVEEIGITQYEATKLAKGILSTMVAVGQKWKGQMPSLYKNNIHYKTCVQSIKNKRRKMEDKHCVIPHFNTAFGLPQSSQPLALFSVFDGHGGTDAACYAAAQFGGHLKTSLSETDDIKEALKQTFIKTDEGFIEKAKCEKLRSGCTGVSVLVAKSKFYVGWLGDSQVVLCKGNDAHELMNPHRPDREDERKRIEELGGCVVWFGGWRVNGSLAVSRAIGDYEQKPYVSGEPDLAEYTFTGDEKFLILACDGLFDVVDVAKAVKLTLEHLRQGKSKASVAEMLVNKAVDCGSMDNITVLVVFLDDHVAKLTQNSLRTAEFERRDPNITDLSEYDVLEVSDATNPTVNGEISNSGNGYEHPALANKLKDIDLNSTSPNTNLGAIQLIDTGNDSVADLSKAENSLVTANEL